MKVHSSSVLQEHQNSLAQETVTKAPGLRAVYFAGCLVDTSGGPAAQSLQKLGGAHVIVATAPDSKSTSPLIDGLAPNGKLVIIGAGPESLTFTPMQVMTGRRTVRGWTSGTAKDSEDTLRFSSLTGVRPVIERYPLEQAAEAYERMHSGKARFRVVLTMG